MINQTDPHKRGRASRTKGKCGELELMHILRDTYGYDVHRGKTYYQESDVVGLNGIHIEVKRRNPMRLQDAMKQAASEAKKRHDGKPTVFARIDRNPWLVCCNVLDFTEITGDVVRPAINLTKRMNPYKDLQDETAVQYEYIKVNEIPLVVTTLETWINYYGDWRERIEKL